MEAAVAVFLLWANPLKDSLMLETSIWIFLQQYQQNFFGWVRYLCLLGVCDQVRKPWPCCFQVPLVTPVDAPSGVLFICFTFWKKTKVFFSVNTPCYVPAYFYLCIINLSFVQPFHKCWDFHFMCKLRFFIYF